MPIVRHAHGVDRALDPLQGDLEVDEVTVGPA
jgi:hypothetical protein